MSELQQLQQIAKLFVERYVALFGRDWNSLSTYYLPTSFVTFEGDYLQGQANIMQKLMNLPISKMERVIDTLDAQVAGPGLLFVFITGRLIVDNETKPQLFSQSFLIAVNNPSQVLIQNEFFRLNYG